MGTYSPIRGSAEHTEHFFCKAAYSSHAKPSKDVLDKKYTNLAGDKGRDYLGDLGINGKIILTRTMKK